MSEHWSNLKPDQSERKNEKHKRFVRSLPCCVSDNKLWSEAAHIRSGTGGGIGYKPHDMWCVPLSPAQHREQHRIGEAAYWGERLELAKLLAQFLWKHTGDQEMCLAAIKAFREA